MNKYTCRVLHSLIITIARRLSVSVKDGKNTFKIVFKY